MYDDLHRLIQAGGELEMPRGVAKRLDKAGYRHPDGLAAMEKTLMSAVLDSDDDSDALATERLISQGVTRNP